MYIVTTLSTIGHRPAAEHMLIIEPSKDTVGVVKQHMLTW